jgi:hypothetical protein
MQVINLVLFSFVCINVCERAEKKSQRKKRRGKYTHTENYYALVGARVLFLLYSLKDSFPIKAQLCQILSFFQIYMLINRFDMEEKGKVI